MVSKRLVVLSKDVEDVLVVMFGFHIDTCIIFNPILIFSFGRFHNFC